MRLTLPLILVVLCSIQQYSQTEAIDTDRPDFAESSIALQKGIFQIETGFVVQSSTEDSEGLEINLKDVSLLGTLLRYGLFDGIELRAGLAYLYHRNSTENTEAEGINELMIGTKIQLVKDIESLPDIALMAHLAIPGSSSFEPSHVEPELIVSIGHELSETFELEYNLGSAWSGAMQTFYGLYAIALGADLTEDLGAYLEFYGQAAKGTEFGKNIDGGFTYLLQQNFQLDASAGIDLTFPDKNWFLSVGASIRLPE